MRARLRSRWQQLKKLIVNILVIAAILVVLIILILIGYGFDWTGFNGYTITTISKAINGVTPATNTTTTVYQPAKTLYDWMQLLIIPLVLAIIAIWFNRSERKKELRITSDNQQEVALQEYIKEMSELLLKSNLRESSDEDKVRIIAHVRTVTVLPRLNGERKGSVLKFLHESGLIDKTKTVIDLSRADLDEATLIAVQLSRTNLIRAHLIGADLTYSDLSEASLSKAILSKAWLFQAILNEATLIETNLTDADLHKANLHKADLHEANLHEANLSEANLSETYLSGANLQKANLCKANLSGADLRYMPVFDYHNRRQIRRSDITILNEADLRGADLSDANLSAAIVTTKQLEKAKSLKGATMPDGSIHP